MSHNKLRLIKRLFKKTLSLIVRVNIVLNRTVVVDSDWHFDNLCGVIFICINCHPSRIMFYYRVVQISIINGMLTAKVTCIDPYHHRRRRTDSRIKFNGHYTTWTFHKFSFRWNPAIHLSTQPLLGIQSHTSSIIHKSPVRYLEFVGQASGMPLWINDHDKCSGTVSMTTD